MIDMHGMYGVTMILPMNNTLMDLPPNITNPLSILSTNKSMELVSIDSINSMDSMNLMDKMDNKYTLKIHYKLNGRTSPIVTGFIDYFWNDTFDLNIIHDNRLNNQHMQWIIIIKDKNATILPPNVIDKINKINHDMENKFELFQVYNFTRHERDIQLSVLLNDEYCRGKSRHTKNVVKDLFAYRYYDAGSTRFIKQDPFTSSKSSNTSSEYPIHYLPLFWRYDGVIEKYNQENILNRLKSSKRKYLVNAVM